MTEYGVPPLSLKFTIQGWAFKGRKSIIPGRRRSVSPESVKKYIFGDFYDKLAQEMVSREDRRFGRVNSGKETMRTGLGQAPPG
jgi:hypothetical protein